MVATMGTHGVGSGDTWFAAPARGTWSQDVRWDGQAYYTKIGIWTSRTEPPSLAIRQIGGAKVSGSASFFPTSAGLPGPLPTRLRFPTVGCWEVTAQGITGSATIRIRFDESAKER